MQNTDWSCEPLKGLPVSHRLEKCPGFLQELVREAEKELSAYRVWIYGSRARKDATSRSDYDIAIEYPASKAIGWARFHLNAVEKVRTLVPVEIVDIAQVPSSLRDVIEREGVLIIERQEKNR